MNERRKYWSFEVKWGKIRAWFSIPVTKDEAIALIGLKKKETSECQG